MFFDLRKRYAARARGPASAKTLASDTSVLLKDALVRPVFFQFEYVEPGRILPPFHMPTYEPIAMFFKTGQTLFSGERNMPLRMTHLKAVDHVILPRGEAAF